MDYIKYDDALEAVWRILNGMGISQKNNERLAEEVDAVLGEYPVESFEPVIKCRDCKHWKTPLAFTATGKCEQSGTITDCIHLSGVTNGGTFFRCDRYDKWQDESQRVYMPIEGFCSYGQKGEKTNDS